MKPEFNNPDTRKDFEDFLYSVSHDLKNPLTMVIAFANMLYTEEKDNLSEQSNFYLQRIIKNSDRIKNMLDTLTAYYYIPYTKNIFENIDVKKMVNNIIKDFETNIKADKIKVAIQDKMPTIKFDNKKLKTVFYNIIQNAVNFIKLEDNEQKIIEIGHTNKNGFYEFFVKDNGPGINPKYHEKIFEIFYQFNNDKSTSGNGTGLTFAKRIIELFGGKIWLESKLHYGSTFFFTIPSNNQNLTEKTT